MAAAAVERHRRGALHSGPADAADGPEGGEAGQGGGDDDQRFVCVAFVIDVFARRFVGWRVSCTARADFVLDAFEPALHDRRPTAAVSSAIPSPKGQRSDRGSRYGAIRYTERLIDAGVEPSVGTVGDSYGNALAESINGLCKAEVIRRRGPWRSLKAVGLAILEWVDWFSHRRIPEPIGKIPPAGAYARDHDRTKEPVMAA